MTFTQRSCLPLPKALLPHGSAAGEAVLHEVLLRRGLIFVLFVRFMVADRAARRCSQETVVTDFVTGDAADCRAFKTPFGLGRNAHGGDRQQQCGAR
jgi:hypothetical protein